MPHFIGTWRNRYCKCFYCGLQGSSSSLKDSSDALRTAIILVDMVEVLAWYRWMFAFLSSGFIFEHCPQHSAPDPFFVSVTIRSHPELQDKPVAVCHSDNPKGAAEISSADYRA